MRSYLTSSLNLSPLLTGSNKSRGLHITDDRVGKGLFQPIMREKLFRFGRVGRGGIRKCPERGWLLVVWPLEQIVPRAEKIYRRRDRHPLCHRIIIRLRLFHGDDSAKWLQSSGGYFKVRGITMDI